MALLTMFIVISI